MPAIKSNLNGFQQVPTDFPIIVMEFKDTSYNDAVLSLTSSTVGLDCPRTLSDCVCFIDNYHAVRCDMRPSMDRTMIRPWFGKASFRLCQRI